MLTINILHIHLETFLMENEPIDPERNEFILQKPGLLLMHWLSIELDFLPTPHSMENHFM